MKAVRLSRNLIVVIALRIISQSAEAGWPGPWNPDSPESPSCQTFLFWLEDNLNIEDGLPRRG